MTNDTSPHPWLAHYPDAIDWHMDFPDISLHDMLEETQARFGSHIAIDFKGKHYSYDELGSKVNAFAKGLQDMGVKPGTRIGLFMPNCPQFVIAYYAILKVGGIVVNYNPLYSATELRHQIDDSGTEIMVTLSMTMLYNKLEPFIGRTCLQKVIVGKLTSVLPIAKAALFAMMKKKEIADFPDDDRHITFASLLESEGNPYPIAIDTHNDIAILQYTGGTTGTPKGVMLTHRNLVSNTYMSKAWFQGVREGEESLMAVLPLFHVFAMTVIMNLSVACGLRMILHPRFELKPLLSDIQQKKPTLMPGVPTMFAAIINYAGVKKYDLSSLNRCISGGAGLPAEVKKQFEAVTQCKLVEGYGLSETSPVAACNPLEGINKDGSIGLPLPGTIIDVLDKDDEITVLPQGEIGEICIRGQQVMRGYWNQGAETVNVLKAGRLHTGDIGYIDEEGYVFIVDRKKEMILSGGYNIYPRHIEEVLYTHEAVMECAVIGIDHATRGQVPKAFIVLKDGKEVTESDMKAFLKQELSAYSLPQTIEFLEELPKSMIGKILKKELS